jgi:hypothetical protein
MRRFVIFIRRKKKHIVRGLIFLLSIVLLVLVFPKEGTFKYEFQKGKPWMHEDLIAPFDFAILKSNEQVESEKNEILHDHYPYFRFDSLATTETFSRMPEVFDDLWGRKYRGSDSVSLRNETSELVSRLLNHVLKKGIIKLPAETALEEEIQDINLLRDNVVEQISLSDVFNLKSAYDFLNNELDSSSGIDNELARRVLEELLIQNIFYDENTTLKERETLLNKLSLKD